MYVAPPLSCTNPGGVVSTLQVAASKNHSVEREDATVCICAAVLKGGESFSKQWLALKNHGSCVLESVSFRSWPVHRYVAPFELNIICAMALRRLRNGCPGLVLS